jgi:hypothetical protein
MQGPSMCDEIDAKIEHYQALIGRCHRSVGNFLLFLGFDLI